ncbi:MAG: LTA synthase family protein [Solobacterium sp.]|nr:LTA synthase family protein [Solobacterium sp.]
MSKKKKKFKKQPKYRSLKENTLIGSGSAVAGRAAIVQPQNTLSAKTFPVHPALILSGFLFYDELLLKISAGNLQWWPHLLHILLFSLLYGILLWILTSLFKNQKTGRHVRIGAVTLTAVLFLANYFIYRQFKVFYDIRTVSAGASDALGEFRDLAFRLVFSKEGLLQILLYLLPCLLYAMYGRLFDTEKRPSRKGYLQTAGVWVAVLALTFGALFAYPASRTSYFDQYNFQNNISSFGLLTALRLDAEKIVFRRSSSFKQVNMSADSDRQNVIMHKANQMNIDFDALAANASSLESSLDAYVRSQPASLQNDYTGLFKDKNLIMITAEAFSGTIIDKDLTPTLYRLATKGFRFTNFIQPSSAGTTGGEYEILFGMLPTNGGSSLKNTQDYHNLMTMGAQLGRLGYEGWAFHNNTYTFYDRDLTHNNLGYSHGYMGYGNGMEAYVEDQWPQSDLEMFQGTMPLYLEQDKPFNVYYMTVSGHNGYDADSNAMSRKNWDRVQDLPYSDPVKGYYAANLELEDAMTYMVQQLEEKGIADDTVIVLCGDHFPYGLDYGADLGQMPYLSELYGHDVTDFLDRDQNRLIIWSGSLEKETPTTIADPVSSLDILPTLSNLFGTEFDSRLFPGRDVFAEETTPLAFDIYYNWMTDKGSYNAMSDEFTPAGDSVDQAYIDRISSIVANKITYCEGFNDTDYFAHVFPSLLNNAGK